MAPTSRIDFTPAQTIVTPVRASVVRSADSSQLSRASRWTPPSPPVANTRMPARAARWEVEATVVAAEPPPAITGARSRSPAFAKPATERQRLERGVVEPDPDLAGHDRDRGRDGALVAHDVLQLAGHLEVAPARQSVRDQGALERHDGLAGGERAGDLRGDPRRGWHPRAHATRPTIRLAGH